MAGSFDRDEFSLVVHGESQVCEGEAKCVDGFKRISGNCGFEFDFDVSAAAGVITAFLEFEFDSGESAKVREDDLGKIVDGHAVQDVSSSDERDRVCFLCEHAREHNGLQKKSDASCSSYVDRDVFCLDWSGDVKEF